MENMKAKNNQTENTCLFVPKNHIVEEDLGIINLVRETACPTTDKFVTGAVFRLCIVTGGTGVFRSFNASYSLKRGDVFLIFPAMPYFISNTGKLEYFYLSFMSINAYHLVENVRLSKTKCYFSGLDSIVSVWETVFQPESVDVELTSHGLLYLTLAHLGKTDDRTHTLSKAELTAKNILKLIDENYCDCTFDLSVLAEKMFYSQKYVSALFKRLFHVSFSAYLAERRVNNAVDLIVSGFTSIKEIAQLSGYDDPLYFSKIFKKMTGFTPRDYIEQEHKKK